MLQQMFEVAATRFHAATQTFAPLISSVVIRQRYSAADRVSHRTTRESIIRCQGNTR